MFSVVVPLHDKRHTVVRTVESALRQEYPHFELIVVDDGSTDGGADELARIGDPRLRVIRQPNAGPGAARNRGIEAARHEWIAFLDADDLWLPGHLAELDRVRAAHPEAGLIGTAYLDTDPQGRFHAPPPHEGTIGTICYLDSVGRGEKPLWTSSAAIRAEVFRRTGGFPHLPSGEDSQYWARIALSWPVARSTRATAVYVHGTGGISDTAGTRWNGHELRRLDDLSPAVAFLLSRYDTLETPELRRAVDRFIDRTFDWCVRGSVRIGDFATLRALPALYPRRPPLEHRVLLSIARLPAPAARALYRLGLGLKAAGRRLRP